MKESRYLCCRPKDNRVKGLMKRRKNRILATGIIGILCLFLWACSSTQPSDNKAAGGNGTMEAAEGAEKSGEGESKEKRTDAENQEEQRTIPDGTEAESENNQSGFVVPSPQDMERVKAQIGWDTGQRYGLEEILSLLEENQVPYTGYYNCTRERLDLELGDGCPLLFIEVSTEMGENPHYELIMKGDELNYYAFQEGFLHQYDVTIDEDFFPNTKEEVLDESQLDGMTLTGLSIARNEFFARRGRIFQDSFLNGLFRQKTWYQPRYSGEEYGQKAEPLSKIEQENLDRILEEEKRKKEGSSWQDLCSGSWLDLNGDGTKEKVSYNIHINPDGFTGSYALTVNGETKTGEGENLYPYVGILSIDESTKLLMAGQDGPSADPLLDIYLYDGQELKSAGMVPGYFRSQEGDYFTVGAQTDFFQTFISDEVYYLDKTDWKIKEKVQEFYPYGNTATALMEIQLYEDKAGIKPSVTIKAGEEVEIVGTDMKTGVKIKKLSTGETGWLPCTEPYYCHLKDGSQAASWELFDGLLFFG